MANRTMTTSMMGRKMSAPFLSSFAEHPLPPRRALAATALIALAVGVYDGSYGPGTGTILMLLLAAMAHQDVPNRTMTTSMMGRKMSAPFLSKKVEPSQLPAMLKAAAAVTPPCSSW